MKPPIVFVSDPGLFLHRGSTHGGAAFAGEGAGGRLKFRLSADLTGEEIYCEAAGGGLI